MNTPLFDYSNSSWRFPYFEGGKSVNWDALVNQFEWLQDMQVVPQDPIWHAEGNVLTHTRMVVEALIQSETYHQLALTEQHILFVSAFMHDIEKRSTTTTELIDGKERIIAPKHAQKGEHTCRTILYKDLPTPFAVREQIAKLVRWHGFPLWAIDKKDTRKAVIEISLSVNTKLLYLLAKADVEGRICQDQAELLLKLEYFKELCLEYDCFGKSRQFASDYGRYLFLNKTDIAPDYQPFNDTKFKVMMMAGLPGSGKDTYIQKQFQLPMISLDAIRRRLKIAPTDKKGNGQVIQQAKELAKTYMRSKQDFVFNATNITRDMRGKWISLFTDYGGWVKLIYLEVPYPTLLKQNQNRQYKVPEAVIDRLTQKLDIPTYKEAHEFEFVIANLS